MPLKYKLALLLHIKKIPMVDLKHRADHFCNQSRCWLVFLWNKSGIHMIFWLLCAWCCHYPAPCSFHFSAHSTSASSAFSSRAAQRWQGRNEPVRSPILSLLDTMMIVDIMVSIDSLSEPPWNLWMGSYVHNISNAFKLVYILCVSVHSTWKYIHYKYIAFQIL